MSRAPWVILLGCGVALVATAFLPSWDVRGASDPRPILIPPFLAGHAIGAMSALAAAAWLARVPWPRAVFWVQTSVTFLLSLFIGVVLHLLAVDCFEHHGRSVDIGVTTAPAIIAALSWWVALYVMVRSAASDPRWRSGRVAAAGAAVALIWFGVFALGNATQVGNHLALAASLVLLVVGWNAASE